MPKRRTLLVIVLVVIIAVSAFAVYFTSPSWLPRSTTLAISPSVTSIAAGNPLVLSASVKYGSAAVSGGTITWQTSGGSLSQSTGTSVIFTPPSVTANQTFTITASFGGNGVYQSSSSTSHVTVSPPSAAATRLTVTPPSFELQGGETQILTATLVSGSKALGANVTWAISPSGVGSLSSSAGASVTYTAPTVQQTTSVSVTASFAGNAEYKSSSGSSAGTVVPAQASTKTTKVEVSPSGFAVVSGKTQTLTAEVEIAGNDTPIGGATVTWTVTPPGEGTVSPTSGLSATYTAPTVQQNTSVTITATYAANGNYLESSGASLGTVMPQTALQFLYQLTFSSASLTSLTLRGPVTMNGTSVTLISAQSANLTGVNMTRFGLTATSMYVDGLLLYTTSINGYSSALGGTVAIKGDQSISRGPIDSASFSNVTIEFVRMEGESANLTGMASAGQFVGGTEPYVPCIITAPSVAMSNTYSITGPTTWSVKNENVSSLTTGRIDLPQFSLQHPVAYTLDRHNKNYNATEVWSLTASSATAIKVSAYLIYFRVTGGEMVTLVVTGNDNPNNLIPFGLNTGGGFNGLNIDVHPVYFSASQLALGSFVISITPPAASASPLNPAGLPLLGASMAVVPAYPAREPSC